MSANADSSTMTGAQTAQTHTAQALDNLSLEEYVKQERFHQSVKFISETTGKEITASYAISGSQAADAKTFLYVGGLIGGRLHGLFPDYLLQKAGVRGIFVDRPGIGRFTSTGIDNRIQVWFEAVPLILKQVGVEKVILVALSGGAPYAFNLLWERPELVDPDAPLFVLSPWVHPSKSGNRLHSWMAWMPASMTRGLSKIATAALERIIAMAYSGKQYQRELNWIGNQSKVPDTCGAEAQEVQRHRSHFVQNIFAEDKTGSTEDYILGVKDPKTTWGACADYAAFARDVSDRCKAQGKTLRVQAFFAKNDFFIGEKGIKYFIDTFSDPTLAPGINFTSEVMEGTDHESVAFPENGAIEKMVELGMSEMTKAGR